MNNHQSFQERLAIYDHLTATEQAQVDNHLRTCPECARTLAAYRTMDQELQQMLTHKLAYLTREPAALQQRLAAARTAPKSRARPAWGLGMNVRSRLPLLQVAGATAMIVLLVFLATLLTGRNPLGTPVTAATPTSLLPTVTAIVTPTLTSPVVTNADSRTLVRFATYDWAEVNYEPLITAFEQANPDLRVVTISIQELLGGDGSRWPDDAYEQMLTKADVVDLFISPRAVDGELVRDLTPFIAADPTFAADDFYPNTLSAFQWDGGTWAVPTSSNFNLIYYDKDLFDQAGVAYPQPGWTWAEFAQTAKAVTQREGEDVTVWGFVNTWGDHLGFIESQSGPLFDAATTDVAARLREPAVLETIQRYVDLFLQTRVSPFAKPPAPENETGFTQESTLVELGQAAMWSDTMLNWEWRSSKRRIGVVTYPVTANRQNSTGFLVDGRTLSAKSAHPEAAWRWLNFLSHQGGRFGPDILPLRPSLATGFWQKLDADVATVMRHAIDHSYPTLYDRPYPTEQALRDAIAATLAGETTVAAALANVPAAAEALRQVQLANAATPMPKPANSGAAMTATVTITYLIGYSNMEIGTLRTLAQQFQQSQPAIKVKVSYPPYQETFGLSEIAATADCFDWSPIVYSPDERSILVNLEPFLATAPSLDRNDFYSGLLSQFTLSDGMWGLPSEAKPKVIEYNKALFDVYKLAYPHSAWTTDEFEVLAKQLTQGAGRTKQYGFAGDFYELSDAELFLQRRGGSLYDRRSDPPAFSFTHPATVAAIQWYSDLTRGQGVKPLFATSLDASNPLGMTYAQRWALLNSGRVGMWTTVIGVPNTYYQLPDGLNTGIVPLPVGIDDKPVADPMSITGYYISAASPHPQACWDWLHFLSEQPIAVQGIPARRSVAESATYGQQVGEERATIYRAILDNYTPPADDLLLFQQPWLAKARPWWEAAYTKIVKGEAGAAEALQAAQQQAEAYRACVIAANAFQDETQQQICATSVGLPGQ